jgi:hypothetical protein
MTSRSVLQKDVISIRASLRCLVVTIGVSLCAACASTSQVDSAGIVIPDEPRDQAQVGSIGSAESPRIDIPRQRMDEALIMWAAHTEQNIITPRCRATRRWSRHVRGTDAIAVLDQLLAGTRLRYEMVNERTVAIRCPD